MKKNIAAIDLFCGAGGLTHGFILEGLKVQAGIDLDAACKYPYEINNQATFIEQDVSQISGQDLNQIFGKSKPGTGRAVVFNPGAVLKYALFT